MQLTQFLRAVSFVKLMVPNVIDFPHFMELEIYYRVHDSTPIFPTFGQINPEHYV
jgi:hypothetical protein